MAGCVAAALATLATLAVGAEPYPSRPVRLFVPYSPGTGPDIIARTLATRLAARWGQQIVVENRPGASGIPGTDTVAKSAPDGHTMLVNVTGLAMGPALYRDLPYDPVTDLTPVGQVATGSMALVVNPRALPVGNFAQFLAAARSRPGEVIYGSTGAGTPQHLGIELLEQRTGIVLLHVPYKATADLLGDLLGGRTHVAYLPVHTALPLAQDGRLRVLAVASRTRSLLAPEAPTFDELGAPDADIELWYAVFGPAALAPEIVRAWEDALAAILGMPEIREAWVRQGIVPGYRDARAAGALLRSEVARWKTVAERAGIRPQ